MFRAAGGCRRGCVVGGIYVTQPMDLHGSRASRFVAADEQSDITAIPRRLRRLRGASRRGRNDMRGRSEATTCSSNAQASLAPRSKLLDSTRAVRRPSATHSLSL
jgi:hypothetical protein